MKVEFDVPDGMPVIDGVAVIRFVDEDGDEAFRLTTYNEPSDIVEMGLLRSAVVLRESEITGFDYGGGE